MLTEKKFSAGGVTPKDGFHDSVVLAMSAEEIFIGSVRAVLTESDRRRTSKRNKFDASIEIIDQARARGCNDRRMEYLIHLSIQYLIVVDEISLGKNGISIRKATKQNFAELVGDACLRHCASGEAFYHGSEFDCPDRVSLGEGCDSVSAATSGPEQAFAGECG
jgi:hypothetical protein